MDTTPDPVTTFEQALRMAEEKRQRLAVDALRDLIRAGIPAVERTIVEERELVLDGFSDLPDGRGNIVRATRVSIKHSTFADGGSQVDVRLYGQRLTTNGRIDKRERPNWCLAFVDDAAARDLFVSAFDLWSAKGGASA